VRLLVVLLLRLLKIDRRGPTPPVIKNRNFDPESRTLRKLGHKDEALLADTVEKNVEGLAEKIVEEDKARRAKELVRSTRHLTFLKVIDRLSGHTQYRSQTCELGSQKRIEQEAGQVRPQDARMYSHIATCAPLCISATRQ
jgi:hypothetical protein